jgi:hypothetical protein
MHALPVRVIIGLSLIVTGFGAHADDTGAALCLAAYKSNLADVERSSNGLDLHISALQAYCSDDYEKTEGKNISDGEAKFLVEEVPVGGKFKNDRESLKEVRHSYCSSNKYYEDLATVSATSSYRPRRDMAEAFNSCLKTFHDIGLACTLIQDKDSETDATFTATYTPPNTINADIASKLGKIDKNASVVTNGRNIDGPKYPLIRGQFDYHLYDPSGGTSILRSDIVTVRKLNPKVDNVSVTLKTSAGPCKPTTSFRQKYHITLRMWGVYNQDYQEFPIPFNDDWKLDAPQDMVPDLIFAQRLGDP